MNYKIKLNQIFQSILTILLVVLSITSCDVKPSFQSDEQMIINLQHHKSELLSLMKNCESQKESGPMKQYTKESLFTCKIDLAKSKKLKIQEMAQRYSVKKGDLAKFKNPLFVLTTDGNNEDNFSIFREEKGYIYSNSSIPGNFIQDGSLDQLRNTKIVEQVHVRESWRFKQIEPNWYLYYRQYFQVFLS